MNLDLIISNELAQKLSEYLFLGLYKKTGFANTHLKVSFFTNEGLTYKVKFQFSIINKFAFSRSLSMLADLNLLLVPRTACSISQEQLELFQGIFFRAA